MDPEPRITVVPVVVVAREASRVWAWLRLVLAGLWLVAMVAAYVTHERPATLHDLYASVAAGEVESVQLIGGLPLEADSGEARLEMHWRTGGVPHVATITEVRPGAEGLSSSGEGSTTDDVAREVEARDPAVRVIQTDVPSSVRVSAALFGWSVPAWVASLMFGAVAGSLGVLLAGPEPWRATRWAWFWLGASPVTLLLFLLLSGPTPGLPAPRNPARRLTGRWGFLLSLVLPHVLTTIGVGY